MSRLRHALASTLALLGAVMVGCAPLQPHYLFSDGDLSHYKDVATEIEHPDVEWCSLSEVQDVPPPLSVLNYEQREKWNLRLEEAVHIALANAKTLRTIGADSYLASGGSGNVGSPTHTTYDPAIQESNPTLGVEGALAEFDAQLAASMLWERNFRPQNFASAANNIFSGLFSQDAGSFGAELAKTAATGGRFALSNTTLYDLNNSPLRDEPSDWFTQFQMEARQPFLQGAGTQFNRINGPQVNRFLGLEPRGVIVARIDYDISLAGFESFVRNMLKDVEDAYRNLYFTYRVLDANKRARDAALETWRRVQAIQQVGGVEGRGGALEESRARQQYYTFRDQVEDSLRNLFAAESRLRFLMGLSATDGRLILPVDEPSTARVEFDWYAIHSEALTRDVDLREQKWRIKRREMELIASRNFLLPRLDGVARYRWLGLGDDLWDTNGRGVVIGETLDGTNAVSTLLDGDFQEWELGLELSLPLGFRRELANVRHRQLLLARERAILEDEELAVSHVLSDAMRNLETEYARVQTNFNRWLAAQDEVDAAQAIVDVGGIRDEANRGIDPIDRLLEAQQRLAQAEIDYYRALTAYSLAMLDIHFRKGSLLEYNNVSLAEGPWPGKAYFDAEKRARARDAGIYVDYGFTRPRVLSQGEFPQFQNGVPVEGVPLDGVPLEGYQAEPTESVPAPQPEAHYPPAGDVPAGQSWPDWDPAHSPEESWEWTDEVSPVQHEAPSSVGGNETTADQPHLRDPRRATGWQRAQY
jgi:outer membrane protein TolC